MGTHLDEIVAAQIYLGEKSKIIYFSSSSKDKHTVPYRYTFGWNSGGSNLPRKEIKKLNISLHQAKLNTLSHMGTHLDEIVAAQIYLGEKSKN